jgi:hypothetical protein
MLQITHGRWSVGVLLLAAGVFPLVGCGTGSESEGASTTAPTAPAHLTVAGLASCLRAGNATVTTSKNEDFDGSPWREEGELEAHLRGHDIFMAVMADERGARHYLGAGVELAGGGATVDGDPIEDRLGRVQNVSVLFSDAPPDATTRRTVESCLGGPMRFDPVGP